MNFEPVWLRVAFNELGVREVEGSGDNPRIVEYHAATSGKFHDDEVPWCSSFVNWCFEQSGVSRTNSALARSWLGWGKSITYPPPGAVAVLSRGAGPQPGPEVMSAPGHVGFYLGHATAVEVLILGGNQEDSVSIGRFPALSVLGFRWPG